MIRSFPINLQFLTRNPKLIVRFVRAIFVIKIPIISFILDVLYKVVASASYKVTRDLLTADYL